MQDCGMAVRPKFRILRSTGRLTRFSCAVLVLPFFLISCGWLIRPGSSFESYELPRAPDYSKEDSWAALPGRVDTADLVPEKSGLKDEQAAASVDVFFVHPTVYFGRTWNQDLSNDRVNKRTDELPLQRQATVFNCCAKIYAPRYRQATLYAFLDQPNGAKALDLAYSDVLRAFDYYLAHFNKGRPFLIASHSQGTHHAVRLVKERLDGKPLARQLVAAYLIGMALPVSSFSKLSPCRSPEETGCVISYRSALDGVEIKRLVHDEDGPYLCTNPLTWKVDELSADAALNPGSVSGDFERIDAALCSARCEKGVLRISEPRVSGYRSMAGGNYHGSDYGLFYMSIRKNVAVRVASFLSRKPLSIRAEYGE